jgi:hypothetical protein
MGDSREFPAWFESLSPAVAPSEDSVNDPPSPPTPPPPQAALSLFFLLPLIGKLQWMANAILSCSVERDPADGLFVSICTGLLELLQSPHNFSFEEFEEVCTVNLTVSAVRIS